MPGAFDVWDLPYVPEPTIEAQHVDGEAALKGFQKGEQYVGLFKFACSLVAQGVPQSYAEILMKTSADNCTPPVQADDLPDGPGYLSIVQKAYAKYKSNGAKGAEAYQAVVNSIEFPTFDEEDEAPTQSSVATTGFEFLSMVDWIHRVDSKPSPGWLIQRIWPADAYGVLAADNKAGKSWAISDLAIAKAAGTTWMSVNDFMCPKPGPVLVFFGEGGERKMLRRMRAIAAHKGVDLASLPITVCFKMPHLTNPEHLAQTQAHLQSCPAELIILDPLYLAARGADGKDLYDMGKHLSAIQEVAQGNNAALVVVTHFKKGEDEGFRRITGVGPGAWGRVLGTATVKSISLDSVDTEEGESDVLMHWEFIGDEISETEVHVQRRIWQDGLDDLDSEMHYEIEEVQINPNAEQKLTPSQERVQQALIHGLVTEPGISRTINNTTGWLSSAEVIAAVASDGKKALDGSSVRKCLYALVKKERAFGPLFEDGSTSENHVGKSQALYWKTAVGVSV